jgi:hypothetical protein
MDYFLGKQSEDSLNAYQRSKLAICRVPNVYAFIPGFYLEDIPTPPWASKGLHVDSTLKIFRADGHVTAGPDFDWGRAYSVTPKTFIVTAIMAWLADNTIIPTNEPIIVCSDRVYSRHELRSAAGLPYPLGGNGIEKVASAEPIYQKFHHVPGMSVSEKDVVISCRTAAAFQSVITE